MDIIDLSRFIGNFETKNFVDFIHSLPESDWEEFADRQKNFESHADTKTIAAIFPDRKDYPNIELKTFSHTDSISELCRPICDAFCRFYGKPFQVTTAMVVCMPPKTNVLLHIDTHPYFGVTHRAHWCLEADYDKMDFFISGEKIRMRQGDFIEINNRMPHAVDYEGEVPRYNLIIDFMEMNR
jgi:hypothetical protein